MEISAGLVQQTEEYNDPTLQDLATQYQQAQFGRTVFSNGTLVPLGVAFVQETTVFREFGPLAGSTMRLAYDVSPKIGDTLSRQTFDGDARYYLRLGGTGVLATRIRGFKSIGDFPDFQYFGGNSEMRGYDYLSFVGQNVLFADAELRFPIIEAALTPFGVVGGVRGVFFANIGGAWFDNQGYRFATSKAEVVTPITGYDPGDRQRRALVRRRPSPGSGWTAAARPTASGSRRSRSASRFTSTGRGARPSTRRWEDLAFASAGGSADFRKPKFAVWIGYDF